MCKKAACHNQIKFITEKYLQNTLQLLTKYTILTILIKLIKMPSHVSLVRLHCSCHLELNKIMSHRYTNIQTHNINKVKKMPSYGTLICQHCSCHLELNETHMCTNCHMIPNLHILNILCCYFTEICYTLFVKKVPNICANCNQNTLKIFWQIQACLMEQSVLDTNAGKQLS